ncbi:MAG: CDP-diacylglycerol--serine O-phosphatidyltransferase [Ulvibacter sp.]|jgi:hypothetical protein
MVLANTCHIIFVKKKWLSFLYIPLSTAAFGKNKTLRGFILLPLFSGFWVFIFSFWQGPFMNDIWHDLSIGFVLGMVYLLSELPNSFVKRRLGIANGEHSKKYKGLQMIIDKVDSLVGMLIFYYLVTTINATETLMLFLFSLFVSLSVSFVLYSLKIKKSF